MNDVSRLRDTIIPKSDQLNADDLIAGPVTFTIAVVSRGNDEQPVVLGLAGGHRPYKPCKSMRRVLISAWGDDGRAWVGRSFTAYCDPEVKFGGVKIGGIRISHLSDIDADMHMALTATKGKRAAYTVKRLKESAPKVAATYHADEFAAKFPGWKAAIESGKLTAAQVCQKAGERAPLTADQHAAVMAVVMKTEEGEVF